MSAAGVFNVGPHRLNHGRIGDPGIERMLQGNKVDVLYTDPPWGDGMMRYFATMAAKHGEPAGPQMKFAELVAHLVRIIDRHVGSYAFVEMGLKWTDQVADAMRPVVDRLVVHECTYQMGEVRRRAALIVGSKLGAPAFTMPGGLNGGLQMVVDILTAVRRPGGTLLDPCCGLGYSTRAAVATGMRFYGNEFDRKRLERAAKFLGSF